MQRAERAASRIPELCGGMKRRLVHRRANLEDLFLELTGREMRE